MKQIVEVSMSINIEQHMQGANREYVHETLRELTEEFERQMNKRFSANVTAKSIVWKS